MPFISPSQTMKVFFETKIVSITVDQPIKKFADPSRKNEKSQNRVLK